VRDAALTTPLLGQLAEDLQLNPRTLQRAVLLYRTYAHPPKTPLSWSHYRRLLTLTNSDERSFYEQLASNKKFSVRALDQAILDNRFGQETPTKKDKRTIPRPSHGYYIFKTVVEGIVDGDTLIARLDLGFSTLAHQRIRLADINAPSPDTAAGKRATAFLKRTLTPCEFVVLQTVARDTYGRYLAHLYYQANEPRWQTVHESGKHLNNELVKRGYAV
jgi:endonuclease YncB( thermonuclease family)